MRNLLTKVERVRLAREAMKQRRREADAARNAAAAARTDTNPAETEGR